MRNNIRIYEVKSKYIDYLSMYQQHIFTNADGSNRRKYIGIILEMNGIKYFALLSSYKEKHKIMIEKVDFIKIRLGVKLMEKSFTPRWRKRQRTCFTL